MPQKFCDDWFIREVFDGITETNSDPFEEDVKLLSSHYENHLFTVIMRDEWSGVTVVYCHNGEMEFVEVKVEETFTYPKTTLINGLSE